MHKKTWYRKYFISYCAIAMIPVLFLGIFVCVFRESQDRASMTDRYQRAITQVSNHLDAIMQDMQETVERFETDSFIDALMEEENDGQREIYMPRYLHAYQESSELETQAMFYYIGDDFLYTSDGKKDYSTFKKEMSGLVDLDYSHFFTRIVTAAKVNCWQMRQWDSEQALDTSLMAFAFPYPSNGIHHVGTFIFLLDIGQIRQVIDSYLDISPDYIYLYHFNYDRIGFLEKEPLNESTREEVIRLPVSRVTTKNLNGTDTLLLKYKSNVFGIQMVVGTEADRLYANYRLELKQLILGTGTILLLAVLVALYLAWYSYRPISLLMERIGKTTDENEFYALNRHLTDVNDHLENLEDEVALTRPILHDRLLLSLLSGKKEEELIQSSRMIYPELFAENQRYFVLVTELSTDKDSLSDIHLEQIAPDGISFYVVPMEEEKLLCAIGLTKDAEDRRLEYLLKMRINAQRSGRKMPEIGVGDLVNSLEQIPNSYLKAYIAWRNKQPEQEKGIHIYQYSSISPSDGEKRDRKALLSLYLQSIHRVEESTAFSLLDELIEAIQEETSSFVYRRFAYLETFSRTLGNCPDDIVLRFQEEAASLEQFSDKENFVRLMHKLTHAVCEAQSEDKRKKTITTFQNILELVNLHYTEPDFSLTTLAELAGYSVTYINRSLRDEAGMTFLQLLSIKRIDRAKELLRTTDLMIKDIVCQVGYFDSASFIRKFKEMEGITPSQYRQASRQEKR